jgi:hypothetical protein
VVDGVWAAGLGTSPMVDGVAVSRDMSCHCTNLSWMTGLV